MRFNPTFLEQLSFYGLCGALVAILWAVFYRKQITTGRLSLKSLFVLILLEAVEFAAIKFAFQW
jgi:hypothetical protein